VGWKGRAPRPTCDGRCDIPTHWRTGLAPCAACCAVKGETVGITPCGGWATRCDPDHAGARSRFDVPPATSSAGFRSWRRNFPGSSAVVSTPAMPSARFPGPWSVFRGSEGATLLPCASAPPGKRSACAPFWRALARAGARTDVAQIPSRRGPWRRCQRGCDDVGLAATDERDEPLIREAAPSSRRAPDGEPWTRCVRYSAFCGLRTPTRTHPATGIGQLPALVGSVRNGRRAKESSSGSDAGASGGTRGSTIWGI